MRKNKRTEHHLRITRFFLATGLFLLGVATHAATLSVTNSADSGAGSLRQAIVDAGSGGYDHLRCCVEWERDHADVGTTEHQQEPDHPGARA